MGLDIFLHRVYDYTMKRWMSLDKFVADMGNSDGLSIDRIDNNKGYSLKNCRWTTKDVQNRNKRNWKQTDYRMRLLCVDELLHLFEVSSTYEKEE